MKEKKNNRRKSTDLDLLLEQMPDLQILDDEIQQEGIRKGRKQAKKKKSSNKEFVRVTYFFVVLFLVMMGYIVYFNAVKSKDIINSPYNVRLDSMSDRVVRGKILDNEGNTLAETLVAEDGTETRNYPYGEISPYPFRPSHIRLGFH